MAKATTGVVVVNADDPRLAAPAFTEDLGARVASFGAGPALRSLFLSDDDLRTGQVSTLTDAAPGGQATVLLESLHGQDAVLSLAPHVAQAPEAPGAPGASAASGTRSTHEVTFTIPGIHNQLNACAALALVLEVLGQDADVPAALRALSHVQAAFGRGEVLHLDGREVQLSLVKNPAGFRMGLLTAATAPGPETVMIAINDEYADGRDMSWLWDVDFSALRAEGVAVVTGVRAWDMALRLAYDEVPAAAVEPDLSRALERVRAAARQADRPVRIFTTYTAMLALRARLGEITDVEEVMK